MKVSIIVPYHNTENEIGACIDSIIAQTYPNIEAILVNDGSTDRSREIVECYIENNHSKCDIIAIDFESNKGASAARNAGIDVATGDYIYFLDSDDQLLPKCIELLVEPLKQKNYDVVIGDYHQIGSWYPQWRLNLREGEWNDNDAVLINHCFRNIYVMPFNKLCNRAFVLRNKLYFEEGVTHEDVLWSLRLCLSLESMYVVKEVTYHYVLRDTSVSGAETWLDEVNAYIHLLPLIVKAFEKRPKPIGVNYKYRYFDNILPRRYKLCFYDHLRDEYKQLRALDPRPKSWFLKRGFKSATYLRGHFHRLLPASVSFPLMIRIYDRVLQQYKIINKHRSIHYEHKTGKSQSPKRK